MDTAPLTIVYIGNFRPTFSTENHVKQALTGLGHTVLPMQENRMQWRRLPTQLRARRVNLLMWTRTWDCDNAEAVRALDQLRALGIPSVSFHLDRWWGLDREYQITSEAFFRTDHLFSPDGGNDDRWAAAGVNHHWSPPAVSAFDCAPAAPDPVAWPHPVVFVGSHPYPHKEWEPYRSQVIDTVRAAVGDQFAVLPGVDAAGHRQPAIREQRLRQLYATVKVVVGDSCLAGGARRYWSDRIPETLGRGAFLIHPRVDGLDEWYGDGEHLALYDQGDWEGLGKAVRWWLEHDTERAEVAAAGRELVHGRDTYTHRMQSVLAEVFG